MSILTQILLLYIYLSLNSHAGNQDQRLATAANASELHTVCAHLQFPVIGAEIYFCDAVTS